VFALALLLVAAGSSFALAAAQVAGFALPGCGQASGCDAASKSALGTIPVLGWPTAFVAAAYFGGAVVGWLFCRRGLSRDVLAVILIGALGSLFFLAGSVMLGIFCPYCVIANLANVAFVTVAALRIRVRPSHVPATIRGAALATGLLVFALISAGYGVADSQAKAAAEARRRESEALMTKPTPPAVAPASTDPNPAVTAKSDPVTPTSPQLSQPPPAPLPTAPAMWPGPFVGRYRQGPVESPVRIVMLTDYQCPDCKKVEAELAALMKKYAELAVSIKYFPFCTDCNPKAGRNLHPNACWGARAAEAAGMLAGTEGFWKMHSWLFSRGGGFTKDELAAGLVQLGFDPVRFQQTMQSPETLARVTADINDGYTLGIVSTPMIFINGVELKGWNSPNALTRTVESLLAKQLPPGTEAADHPPLATARLLADWRDAPAVALPDPVRPARGPAPADAGATVIIYGDYLEPGTFELDTLIRSALASRPDGPRIRYEFRYFPVDQSCNPTSPRTQFAAGCLAARAAEGARLMGGSAANTTFWAMHEWLMNNRDRISEQAIMDGAPAIGLPAESLSAGMNKPEATQRIKDDAAAMVKLGAGSIPAFFLNGKLVPRWKVGVVPIIQQLFDEAAKR